MLAEAKAQAKELICCEPHEGESGVSYMRSRLAIREVAVSLGDNWYSIFWELLTGSSDSTRKSNSQDSLQALSPRRVPQSPRA